jgi:branched-subunit amino acid aminotransferase/4-amino-4-deoxychorismate lyase
MGSISSRFIEEAVFGVSSSGSVRLPECPKRPLWLVVVKGLGKKPLMLLTTEPMRRNRKVLWWAVETYLTRWRVENTIRFIKQSYNFEDIRVLTYKLTYNRLKNMATLVLAASYFAAVWLGTRTKLNILAMHAMNVKFALKKKSQFH